MTTILIKDLTADKHLDKAALSKILGGSDTSMGSSIAVGGYTPSIYKDCYVPCYPNYCGPKAFQFSYNTYFEEAYYQKSQTNLNLTYFQA